MVRIYGNRQIKTLRGLETRPTTARVREALFNMWQANLAWMSMVRPVQWQWLHGGRGPMPRGDLGCWH